MVFRSIIIQSLAYLFLGFLLEVLFAFFLTRKNYFRRLLFSFDCCFFLFWGLSARKNPSRSDYEAKCDSAFEIHKLYLIPLKFCTGINGRERSNRGRQRGEYVELWWCFMLIFFISAKATATYWKQFMNNLHLPWWISKKRFLSLQAQTRRVFHRIDLQRSAHVRLTNFLPVTRSHLINQASP